MKKVYLSDESAVAMLGLLRDRVKEMLIHDKTIHLEDKKTWPKNFRQLFTCITAITEARNRRDD